MNIKADGAYSNDCKTY